MNDPDRLLHDDASVAIPDDGFSARVMAALPPAARAPHPWLKPALVFGSAALGSVLAAAFAPTGPLLQGFADLVQLRALTPGAITAIAIGATLTVSALVLAADADS